MEKHGRALIQLSTSVRELFRNFVSHIAFDRANIGQFIYGGQSRQTRRPARVFRIPPSHLAGGIYITIMPRMSKLRGEFFFLFLCLSSAPHVGFRVLSAVGPGGARLPRDNSPWIALNFLIPYRAAAFRDEGK